MSESHLSIRFRATGYWIDHPNAGSALGYRDCRRKISRCFWRQFLVKYVPLHRPHHVAFQNIPKSPQSEIRKKCDSAFLPVTGAPWRTQLRTGSKSLGFPLCCCLLHSRFSLERPPASPSPSSLFGFWGGACEPPPHPVFFTGWMLGGKQEAHGAVARSG